MNYVFRKNDKKVSDTIPRIDHQDLLFNKASKDTISESYLGCYGIYSDNNLMKELYVLIVPEVIIHNMIKDKFNKCGDSSINCVMAELILSDTEYEEFEHTRFSLDKWEYIGDSTEDIIIENYTSEILPFDNDSDISKLLKETLSKTIHAITDDKRKYWLTQLYSRIRRTNNTIEDKTTLYNKMKLLEQFSEDGLEITIKVRDQEGRLERITHHVKI